MGEVGIEEVSDAFIGEANICLARISAPRASAPVRVAADPVQALRQVLWEGGVDHPGACARGRDKSDAFSVDPICRMRWAFLPIRRKVPHLLRERCAGEAAPPVLNS